MSYASIGLLALAIQQVPGPEALPPDRPLDIVLSSSDAVLAGHGPSRRFRFTAPDEGVLAYIWASSREIDPFVRVEDGAGKLLAEDEDSGGATTAFVKLEVAARSTVSIEFAAHAPGETGAVRVAALAISHIAPSESAALQRAKAAIADAVQATKQRHLDEARKGLGDAIDSLLALDGASGGKHSFEVDAALWEAGYAAADLHVPELCRAAWTPVYESRSKRLPDEHPGLQDARVNLANTLADLGELSTARTIQEHALEIYMRTQQPGSPYLLRARVNLSITLAELGELEGARDQLMSILALQQKALPDEHPALQQIRLNLAATLRQLGDLTSARALLEHYLAVAERTHLEDNRDVQAARLNLSNVLRSLGDLEGARSLEEQALEVLQRILPADHPDILKMHRSMALTQRALGHLETARDLEQQALDASARTLPADHPLLQAARVDLARTLSMLGQQEPALKLLDQVLASYTQTLPPDHPDLLVALESSAGARFALKDFAGARAIFERVLAARERSLTRAHPFQLMSRFDLAASLAAQRVVEERISDADRARFVELSRAFAVGLRQSTIDTVLSVPAREAEERATTRSALLSCALSLAEGLSVMDHDERSDELAFLAGESARAVAQSSSRILRDAHVDPEYEPARRKLRLAGDELAKRARSGGSEAELAEARAAAERAEVGLLQLAQRINPDGSRALQADLPALAATLGADDAMLAYRRYTRTSLDASQGCKELATESLCAFVLRPGEGPGNPRPRLTRVELGPISAIAERAERWRTAIAAPVERGLAASAAPPQTDALGDALRESMFDPLRPALGDARRIVVALDDVLHLVPLDALPDLPRAGSKERALLGDSYSLELRPTLLECLAARPPATAGGMLVALGDPDLDHDPEDPATADAQAGTVLAAAERTPSNAAQLRGSAWERGFVALPGTSEEVRAIGRYFESAFGKQAESHVLEKREASREKLFELAPKARFLHVATHGWFAPESIASTLDAEPPAHCGPADLQRSTVDIVSGMSPMLLCGLALSGANLPADFGGRIPGLVTAQELATLDLSGCELAVLSACDTNVGLRRAGQGVASLQKSLHLAGARSVITALWKVPDEATRELMADFYRRIWLEKKPKSRALWEAKSKLRKARDPEGRPRFATRDWAAWVLTGEPN